MAKIKTRKQRKIRFPVIFFMSSLLLSLITSLVLGIINVKLTYSVQEVQHKIDNLKEENQELRLNISQLKGSDRIIEIATTMGLTKNNDNAFLIKS